MEILKVHPFYHNYGYNVETDQIVHIPTNRNVIQRPCHSGYCSFMASDGKAKKGFWCHRFVWECCNDIIPKGYEIDHINKNKTDNTISNLRCITIQENRKNRDHTNIIINGKNAYKLMRFIKAINTDTNEFNCFRSKNQCGRYYGISPALVYLIIECKNHVKTANTNKGKFIFEYVDEKDVENLILIPRKNCQGLEK